MIRSAIDTPPEWRKMLIRLLLLLGAMLVLPTATVFCRDESPVIEKLKEYPAELHGKELPVDLLLRSIGNQAGINFFVSEKIAGTITIDLENISLYEIFKIITDTKHLSYTVKNNVVIISRQEDAAQEIKEMITVRLCTRFGNAEQYVDQLKPLLQANGRLTVSNQGDCLIVKDIEETIDQIEAILTELDQPTAQVYIEARVVSVTQDAKERLGIDWNYQDTRGTGVVNLNTNSLAQTTNLDPGADPSGLDATSLFLGFIKDSQLLNVELQAMQKNNFIRILSSPRVLVIDGQEAEIKQGKEVAYTSSDGNVATTEFKEATLSLLVTPRILRNNYISLNVEVKNDSVDLTNQVGNQALLNKQGIKTSLFLENNSTIVIGGILTQNNSDGSGRVPYLSAIPLLGWFFKNQESNDDQTELLVFITPTIVNVEAGTAPQRDEIVSPHKKAREEKQMQEESAAEKDPAPPKS